MDIVADHALRRNERMAEREAVELPVPARVHDLRPRILRVLVAVRGQRAQRLEGRRPSEARFRRQLRAAAASARWPTPGAYPTAGPRQTGQRTDCAANRAALRADAAFRWRRTPPRPLCPAPREASPGAQPENVPVRDAPARARGHRGRGRGLPPHAAPAGCGRAAGSRNTISRTTTTMNGAGLPLIPQYKAVPIAAVVSSHANAAQPGMPKHGSLFRPTPRAIRC